MHVQIVPVVQSRQGLSVLCDHSTNKVVSDLDLQQQFCYGANCTYMYVTNVLFMAGQYILEE